MTSKPQFCLFLIITTLVVPNIAVRDFEDGPVWKMGREILQVDNKCGDVLPPDATFDCNMYATLGICDNLELQYCKQSCNKCDDVGAVVDVSCEDVVLPGLPDCSTVVTQNLCQDASVQGIYCNASCGVCGGSVPPSPPPTTGSVFTSLLQTSSPTVVASDECDEGSALQCDIDALLAFKNSATRGFSLLSSWDDGDASPCFWKYVTCKRVDGTNQRVTELDFDFRSDTQQQFTLTASLVPDFSKLRYVNKFNIAAQNVTGSLPKEYSVLNRLQEFQTDVLELTGTLPSEYSVWTLLQNFDTSSNQLTGTLPLEYSEFLFLVVMDLSENKFSGTFPIQYTQCSDLIIFELADNQFSGIIPPQYSAWANCNYFSVSENQITGTLPADFSVLSAMERLYVYENELTGSLPPSYSTWKFCNRFYSNENFLTGSLPEEYSTLTLMEQFAAWENRYTGTLPVQYSEWRDCERFGLRDNRLSGTLPPEYSEMKFTEFFFVSSNSFISGTLPVEYSTMKFMQLFYSFDTAIVGSVPDEWLLTWSPEAEIFAFL